MRTKIDNNNTFTILVCIILHTNVPECITLKNIQQGKKPAQTKEKKETMNDRLISREVSFLLYCACPTLNKAKFNVFPLPPQQEWPF